MAYYKVNTEHEDDFIRMLKERHETLVTAMVKGVLDAAERGLKKVDLIEVQSGSKRGYYVVTAIAKEYGTMLKSCLDDMIRYENYELCAKIKNYLDEHKDL
jgi:hypothetical protein